MPCPTCETLHQRILALDAEKAEAQRDVLRALLMALQTAHESIRVCEAAAHRFMSLLGDADAERVQ